MANKEFEVRQAKSTIGRPETQRKTLAALGLGRIGDKATLADNPANRGQIRKVQHLVSVTVRSV